MKERTIRTVVIGSGCAGLNAADTLSALGERDLALVTENLLSGTSRNTGSDKQTYYKLSLAGDDPDSVGDTAQTLQRSDVHGDTALCEAANSARCFLKLAALGVPFPTNEYGEYVGYQTDHDTRRRASSAGPLTSRYMTEALDDLRPNEVYIATGAHNSALWGELFTACAKARGAVGAVLDGYTRDTPRVIEQNFPVFCTGTWAQDSSVRTYVFKWCCPIEIGQATIHNGDIVFGDVDGVLIIPRDVAPEVIERALEKASTEKTMRRAIEDGMLVTEAFAKFGVL